MKCAFQIFKRDIRRLARNPVAMIVVAGVCLLPSLYAWFNIAANMDPYGNTGAIQIAVANLDQGTDNEITGALNAGEEVVTQLKKNHDLGWKFMKKDQAVNGVKSGKYYAAIVIPENFSESLTSVLTGKIEQPQFTYYLNEKKNAIAPKITDSGATAVQSQVNEAFVSAASEAVSEIFKNSIAEVAGNLDTLQGNVVSDIQKVSDNIESYEQILAEFQKSFQDSDAKIKEVQNTMDQVKSAASSGAKALDEGSAALQAGRNSVSSFSSALSGSLTEGENILSDIGSSAGADLGSLNEKIQSVSGKVDSAMSSVNSVIELNEKIIDLLSQLDGKIPGNPAADLIAQLQAENQRHQELLSSLKAGNEGIGDAAQTATNTAKKIGSLVRENQQTLRGIKENFDGNVLPGLNTSLDSFGQLSGKLSGVLSGVDPLAEQTKGILDNLNTSLNDSKTALESTGTALQKVQEKLDSVIADLNALRNSQSYQDFLNLTGLDSKSISDFVSAPVELKTESFYSVKNYGSAMTPFYTNLAIWVGGIVLIAIFKLESDKDEIVPKFTAVQSYFGRWMLYVVMGLIQSLSICVGDLLFLGVQCKSPGAFIFAGLFTSFVYVNIIYALSITFKHIGKAISVILVIIQIPGSAGTYPIEMTPAFFQRLHPLLPFTYGINAMREAVAGIYGFHYVENLLCLAVYVPIALLIGIVVRPWLLNMNHMFDQKLGETELMICEEEGLTKERFRMAALVSALADKKAFRQDMYQKAERFEKNYKKRIRRGFVAILIIPLIFLILMFSISSKMVFLVLWIASIIVIAVYLICVEYIHESLKRRLKMSRMSQEELLETLRKRKEQEEEEA